MLSKCIKMPKYSFKRNLFFVTDWVWPTHHTSHAVRRPHHTLCQPGRAFCWPHRALCQPHKSMTRNIWSTSSSKIFKVFLHFLRWKNKFFPNCSKLPKNHFRTIKKIFFQIFFNYKGGWVSQTKSGKFHFFFFNWTLP